MVLTSWLNLIHSAFNGYLRYHGIISPKRENISRESKHNLDQKKSLENSRILYVGFLKWWYPQNTPKWSFLVGKPVVGYHHFRKPPYIFHMFSNMTSTKARSHGLRHERRGRVALAEHLLCVVRQETPQAISQDLDKTF